MSSLSSAGYESARPTQVCAASGRRFEPGERYVATLAEDQRSGEIARFDFGVSSWEAGERPSETHRVFAVWRPVASDSKSEKSLLVGSGEMLHVFEGLEEASEGRLAVFRYLLALLLVRKRQLRLTDQRVGGEGRPVLVLTRKAGSPDEPDLEYEVVDPGMDEEAIAVGMEELGAVVGGERE